MKNLIFASCGLLFFLMNSCASAQKNDNEINQKLDTQSDKEIVLVKVVNDSRCPEGVQCIWAGEVTIDVAAYENKKIVEQVQFTINRNSAEEVKNWFIKHLPPTTSILKEVNVTPYPKEGIPRKPGDYVIQLIY